MINSGIYKITNIINQKVYIGSAINLKKRERAHFFCLNKNEHHSILLQNSFNKHGLENFYFEVIEYIEDKTKLIEREQYYIDLLNPIFNVRKIADSNFGIKWSKETREKMSKSAKIKYLSNDHWNKGKKHSEETKLKIGKASKGRKSRLGIKNSDETRLKLSNSLKGRVCPNKGKKMPIGFNDKYKKQVLQIDLVTNEVIKEWSSIKLVKEILKISNISRVCKGKCKNAGGFKWKYKEEKIWD